MPTATVTPGISNGVVRLDNGVAIIEIQGALNRGSVPLVASDTDLNRDSQADDAPITATDIGEIELEEGAENGSSATMIVGRQQLMRGKVVKLANPLAVLELPTNSGENEEVKTLEVVTHKIVFNQRPEPYIAGTS